MTDNNDDKRTLDLPHNINLPFFAYGIFKPGQLAYSKIRNHVDEYENGKIHYEMKLRDGVPILTNLEKDYFLTKGTVISFKKGHEREAYDIISKTELRKLYEWKTIRINETEVNILFGVKPSRGSNIIEDNKGRISFDGKNDPLFTTAIQLVEKNLNSDKHLRREERFFELQMNYMLLWSAIDRYSSIKYNEPSKGKNNDKFAKEKAFEECIMKFKDKTHVPVYSTEDIKIYKFDADNPARTIRYYYTFRCNVVHRGKSLFNDYDMLKTATEELLEIFKEVLRKTFYEP